MGAERVAERGCRGEGLCGRAGPQVRRAPIPRHGAGLRADSGRIPPPLERPEALHRAERDSGAAMRDSHGSCTRIVRDPLSGDGPRGDRCGRAGPQVRGALITARGRRHAAPSDPLLGALIAERDSAGFRRGLYEIRTRLAQRVRAAGGPVWPRGAAGARGAHPRTSRARGRRRTAPSNPLLGAAHSGAGIRGGYAGFRRRLYEIRTRLAQRGLAAGGPVWARGAAGARGALDRTESGTWEEACCPLKPPAWGCS